jgi:hypothetical protein
MLRYTYIASFVLRAKSVASGCSSEVCSRAEKIDVQCPLCSIMSLSLYSIRVFHHAVDELPIVSVISALVPCFTAVD